MLRQSIYCSLVLIAFLSFLHPNLVDARVIEQIIVVIDGEPYTLSNLKEYAKTKMDREFPSGDLEKIGKEDKEVLEQFITEKLLEAEVRQAGIKVSEEEIDRYVGQIKGRTRISDEELTAALKREGVSMEKYRASVKAEIEKGEIINHQVRKKVNITSEDVERYYRMGPKKFMTQNRVKLRHILFSIPEGVAPERERDITLKAVEIRGRVVAGEDFAILAGTYSEGAGASEGGDIGWVSRGSLLQEIDEVVFNKLSVGEVSQPLRTSLGIHLVKLEAREAGRVLSLPEVQGKIKEELYAKALEERFQKWLKADLRKRHRVDIKLPGVVFRPEDMKEGTVDSLVASTSRRGKRESSFWSYLNPLSYIVKETPIEGGDAEGALSGENIVSIFGVPLFKSDSVDDVPEDLLAPVEGAGGSSQKSEESGGFFSSILKALNPFSR